MPEEKNYSASTGVDEFYYGKELEGVTVQEIERVRFLQNINVEMPQEIVRAFGDNTTAEMAVSSGNISVTSGFHKMPLEDKTYLLGWEESDGGLVGSGSLDNPPYVPVVFAKTYEDGSREYVGLPRGMFTRPTITGQTKGETTEFSSEEIVAQFMDREVDGFTKNHSVIFAYDEPGETTQRDLLFQKIFGMPHPGDGSDNGGVEG
jgi:phi13 family phage major tail protein